MVDVHDYVEQVANRFETLPRPGESNEDFRMRLSQVILDRTGDGMLSLEILLATPREMFTPSQKEHAKFFEDLHEQLVPMRYALKGDTYRGMDIYYYRGVLENNGFVQHLAYDYLDPYTEKQEEYSLWFREAGAMLLSVETSKEKLLVVDSNMWCELSHEKELGMSQEAMQERLYRMHKGTKVLTEKGHVATTMRIDADQGLVEKLNLLDQLNLNTPWKHYNSRLLYLCDTSEMYYMSREKEFYEYNKDKIRKLPLKVRWMLGEQDIVK